MYKAIMAYFRLQKTDMITLPELKIMVGEMKASGNLKRGAKKQIEAMDEPNRLDIFDFPPLGFTNDFLEFKKPVTAVFNLKSSITLANMIEEGYSEEDLKSDPVIVGTVHSVKGGEADNVWIDTTSHTRMASANMDDELRIAYVAITRARRNVGLLQPMGLRNMLYFL